MHAGFREASQREIAIPDIKYDVFIRMLEYLYTGVVSDASPSSSLGLETKDEQLVDLLQVFWG